MLHSSTKHVEQTVSPSNLLCLWHAGEVCWPPCWEMASSHEDHEQVSSWGFENPALSILLNWRVTRAEGAWFPRQKFGIPGSLYTTSSVIFVWVKQFMLVSGAVAQNSSWPWHCAMYCCLGGHLTGTNCAERQGDKSWMKHISLKDFHWPQILISLAYLPQLVHREETFRWFAMHSNQCDTLKIKYAIFPKCDQKSLEVCGKSSSGFPKVESGSIIHESCFHDIGKKRPLFSILHCLTWIYTLSVLEALMRWFQQKSVDIKSPL